MAKYKIFVKISEQNEFWIAVDNGKFIRCPTEENLKNAILKSYSKTNICPICWEEYEKDGKELIDKCILYPGNVGRNTDKNGKKIDEMVCKAHSLRNYNRYDSNSHSNIKKSMRDCRTGRPRYHNQILGDIYEELTEKWLGAERLSKKYDKYSQLPLDHGPITKHISVIIGDKLVDLYGKIPQTKGRWYIPTRKNWDPKIVNEHGKKFDILILYCASKDGKMIERIYIFPYSEVIKRENITVYGYTVRNWYEPFRVTDKEETKKVNNILQSIVKGKNK